MRDDREYLAEAMGRLWMAGVEIDWNGYYEGERRRRVSLPTYPFERQRYWITAGNGVAKNGGNWPRRGGEDVLAAAVNAMADAPAVSTFLHPRPALANAYVAPANDREIAIAAIWQAALGVDKVGVNDNFFELGGDSVIAIQVISQLKDEFKIDIPVASLYERLTIKSFDALISLLTNGDGEVDGAGAQSTDRDSRAIQRKRFQEAQRLKRSV
jgi:phthiocerol/phenolphthiocerol synthesis type-I polyketide synthase E